MKPLCRIAVLLPAVLILASGCATKGWVRETLDKKEAEIDQRVAAVGQRVDTVDGRVTQESERIQGVGSRVTTIETTVTEVSEAARGAKEASNAALAKSDDVDRRVTRLLSVGLGPTTGSSTPEPQKRRVTAKLMLEQD